MLLQPLDIPGNEEPRIMMILSIFSAYLSLSNTESHKTFNMTLLFKWYFLSLFWGKNWILGFESHETESFWSNNKDRNQWLHYLKVGDFHLNPFALKVFHLQTHKCGVWWNRIHLGLIIKHPCWWNIIIHPCWVRNWSKIPSASTKLPLGSRKKGSKICSTKNERW